MKKIFSKCNEFLFNLQCRKIRDTPPIEYRYRNDLKIVTQVHHAAMDMYLVAIKSFLYHNGSGSVEILTDGSLTSEDKQVLKQHIPRVNIVEMDTIDTKTCPKGACWERLIFVLNLSKSAYVIQLDSDTFSLSPMPEIQYAIENEYGFTIGNPRWILPVPTDYLADNVSKWDSNHVQVEAEKNFHQLPFFQPNKKYIRGCAAVTGFPKNQVNLDMLEEFSQQITKVIGSEKWSEWGSEQVSSNVLVSQTNSASALAWPRYQNYKQPIANKDTVHSAALIHFIGSHRYEHRQYEKLVSSFIKLISKNNG